MTAQPVITLTTDFGTDDVFVGVMKGVMLGVCPAARIVDLTHAIPSFDIVQAAFKLRQAAPYFPQGTVHVVVVDPGVGSARRVLAMKSGGQYFVAPDNGVLTLVAGHGYEACVEATASEYFLPEVSASFHGRDVFAPLGAHIASGVTLSDLGSDVTDRITLDIPVPETDADGAVHGTVLWCDRFGNLVTNIPASSIEGDGAEVFVNGRSVGAVRRTYSDVNEGVPLAMVGSFGNLEIAVCLGSARECLSLDRGASVKVVMGQLR